MINKIQGLITEGFNDFRNYNLIIINHKTSDLLNESLKSVGCLNINIPTGKIKHLGLQTGTLCVLYNENNEAEMIVDMDQFNNQYNKMYLKLNMNNFQTMFPKIMKTIKKYEFDMMLESETIKQIELS